MAEVVLTNAYLAINGVDLSDHVKQVTLNYSAEPQDKSAMGVGTRRFLAGLKNWTLDVVFNQDFAASKVDATLFPLVGAAAHSVALRYDNGTIAATNPEYQGSGVLVDYPPIGGQIGQVLEATARWVAGSDLVRDTTP